MVFVLMVVISQNAFKFGSRANNAHGLLAPRNTNNSTGIESLMSGALQGWTVFSSRLLMGFGSKNEKTD
jgi:hypothetical protein